MPIHCFYLPLNHLFLSAIVPEQLYCNEKVIFCYKQFDSTRIAGGLLFRTSPFLRWEKLRCTQQAKAHKEKVSESACLAGSKTCDSYSNSSLQSCFVVFVVGFGDRNQGVLSDFHLLCGFTRDCIVILLSEYFNLNIRQRNPCHSNFITNIRSHTCVPTTNSLQISISRKLFCIYISCSVTSLCS